MAYEEIIYSKEEAVATLTLNRPQRMNAYTPKMLEEIHSALDDAQGSEETRVLVLTGAGRGVCSGADISGSPLQEAERSPLHWADDMRQGFSKLLLRLRALDKPTIASINGAAVAGGLTLALICDLRVASDRARLGDGSLRFGFVPDEGGTYFMPRILGIAKALELVLFCDIVDANEALKLGLVNKVVPHDELREATRELAARIAEGPPIAQRLAKRAMYRQLDMDLESSLEELGLAAQIANETEDAAEGIKAFFVGRKPQFRGR